MMGVGGVEARLPAGNTCLSYADRLKTKNKMLHGF